jgi:hypothetical protein
MEVSGKIEKLLGDFGELLTLDTRSSLKKKLDERRSKYSIKNSRTQSNLSASIKPLVTYSKGGIGLRLTMNDYWEVVNDGRQASGVSEDGQNSIAEWSASSGFAESIRLSNLAYRKDKQTKSKAESKRKRKWKTLKKMPFELAKKQAGFLVARSLKKKSIKPTHFFDEVIKDGRLEELKLKIAELIKTDLVINIRNGVNGNK